MEGLVDSPACRIAIPPGQRENRSLFSLFFCLTADRFAAKHSGHIALCRSYLQTSL